MSTKSYIQVCRYLKITYQYQFYRCDNSYYSLEFEVVVISCNDLVLFLFSVVGSNTFSLSLLSVTISFALVAFLLVNGFGFITFALAPILLVRGFGFISFAIAAIVLV